MALLDDLDRLDVATGLTDGSRQTTQGSGDVGELDTQQERHPGTLTATCDTHVTVPGPGQPPTASRGRSPLARWTRRSTAARTASGVPTTVTLSRARVTAV